MIALTVWMCVAVVGFGALGMAVGSVLALAESAPEPKLGRFRRERERFRARGVLARALTGTVRLLAGMFWHFPGRHLKFERYLHWQEHQLRLAGFPLGFSSHEIPILSVGGSILLSSLAQVASSSSNLTLGAALIGLILPQLRIQALRSERVRAAAREIPRTMDLLSLCMSAGMDLVAGLKEVSAGDRGVVAEELHYLLASLEMGQTRRAALREFHENLPALEVGDFTRAIIQAEAKGASVRDALMNQAAMSRQRRSVRAEELAARASVLLTLPVMMLVVCVLILVLGPMIADPSQF